MSTSSISVPNIVALKPPNSKSAKQIISTATLIEIRCETPETNIYYTIDGSKPDPFSPFGDGKNSIKYKAPFTLPSGKINIKAIAFSKDNTRESRHVSKSFIVEGKPEDENNNETKSKSQPNSPGPVKKSNIRLVKQRKSESGSANSYPDSDSESLFQRVADPALAASIICPSCCAPRPKGSTSKFCTECGTLFPDQMKPISVAKANSNLVPALGTMGMCVHCRSYVPLNMDYCIICEAPIKPQLPKHDNSSEKLQCPTCSSMNPLIANSCLVCEGSLSKAKKVDTSSKPPLSISQGLGFGIQVEKCNKCGTQNPQNAGFCSNCGKKINDQKSIGACPKCKLILNPGTKFCLACGTLVNQIAMANTLNIKANQPDFEFTQRTYSGAGDKQTQTPPATSGILTNQLKLTPVSPGKGSWRKQIEHIVGHLKQYTQDMPEFQGEISDQKFGQIMGASVVNTDVVSTICIDFKIVPDLTYGEVQSRHRQAAKNFSKPRSGRSKSTDGNHAKQTPVSVNPTRSDRKSADSRQSRQESRVPKLTEQSEELLKELQMPDQNVEHVVKLLDDGADANCKNSNGVPAIGVAISHNFAEAIQPLVEAGADVNAKYGTHGNTCLHEAVMQGTNGLAMVTALVKLGADVHLFNKRSENAHDLALRINNVGAAEILATHISHKILLQENQKSKIDDYDY